MEKFNTLGEAWVYGLRAVLGKGKIIGDDDVSIRDITLDADNIDVERYKNKKNNKLNLRLKELTDYHIVIRDINKNDPIILKYANLERILYTIKRYGVNCGKYGYGEFIYGKNGNKINEIIVKLKNNTQSKSSIIISPNSWEGNGGKPPCLTAISFLIRENLLIMFVVYRSQNIYTKQPGNLIALRRLQKKIADGLKVACGEVHLYCISAHIYEPDWINAKRIIDEMENV